MGSGMRHAAQAEVDVRMKDADLAESRRHSRARAILEIG